MCAYISYQQFQPSLFSQLAKVHFLTANQCLSTRGQPPRLKGKWKLLSTAVNCCSMSGHLRLHMKVYPHRDQMYALLYYRHDTT